MRHHERIVAWTLLACCVAVPSAWPTDREAERFALRPALEEAMLNSLLEGQSPPSRIRRSIPLTPAVGPFMAAELDSGEARASNSVTRGDDWLVGGFHSCQVRHS